MSPLGTSPEALWLALMFAILYAMTSLVVIEHGQHHSSESEFIFLRMLYLILTLGQSSKDSHYDVDGNTTRHWSTAQRSFSPIPDRESDGEIEEPADHQSKYDYSKRVEDSDESEYYVHNCHPKGPSSHCPCRSDPSFVFREPNKSFFRQKKRLLILDIDETILSSLSPIIGYDLFLDNRSEKYLPSLGPAIDGVWQNGFEMFFLHEVDIVSLMRPDFFKMLHFVQTHDFNVILYTRYYCHLQVTYTN